MGIYCHMLDFEGYTLFWANLFFLFMEQFSETCYKRTLYGRELRLTPFKPLGHF